MRDVQRDAVSSIGLDELAYIIVSGYKLDYKGDRYVIGYVQFECRESRDDIRRFVSATGTFKWSPRDSSVNHQYYIDKCKVVPFFETGVPPVYYRSLDDKMKRKLRKTPYSKRYVPVLDC